ncbi:MAG: diguanylate cyclase [Planctomycetota bacterium]|nr:diguanylate cyclase [Planctomycetota bacterium]
MKLNSSTTFISFGLASLTLSLVLMAHSLGIAPDESQELLRARIQTAELVAAQCSPAAIAGDMGTMSTILKHVGARNADLLSAGLRNSSGKLIYQYGSHNTQWSIGDNNPIAPTKLTVPIASESGDWGSVEFCFRRNVRTNSKYLSPFFNGLIANPLVRLGGFVFGAGFIAFYLYLRRTLRYLDPSSVIPPRVRAMLDAITEGVIVLDKPGRIILANESFCRGAGRTWQSLQGQKADELGWKSVRGEEAAEVLPWTKVLESGQAAKGMELSLEVEQDEKEDAESSNEMRRQRIFSVHAAPVLGPDGRIRGALATFDDVTEVEKMNLLLKESRDEVERQNTKLRILATTDPMTQCLNRRSFLEQFEAQWQTLDRGKAKLGVVMVDVDKFKSINDQYGHAAGDTVLKEVARVLRMSVGEGGYVCRYGGEEFCVLLPGRDATGTEMMAEHLRQAIECWDWAITPVTASMGVAGSEQGAADVKTLLDQADSALYASKRNGRNRVTRWGDRPAEPAPIRSPALPVTRPREESAPMLLRETRSRLSYLAIATALAHRHPSTALHCGRVAEYCLRVAPGILPPDQAAELEVAALLHDVGKIGVPDAILNKPGPLTAEEWQIMRSHDLMGVDIASAAGMPSNVICIIASHHATYIEAKDMCADASEYMRTAARLLSIADAFDAMTSERPYRRPIPIVDAFKELRRCAGKQFDPALVEHFIVAMTRGQSTAADQSSRAA